MYLPKITIRDESRVGEGGFEEGGLAEEEHHMKQQYLLVC